MAKDNQHSRLEQGVLFHCRKGCDRCRQTTPDIRTVIDEEHDLEIIDRHTACDGFVYDFSVGLYTRYPSTDRKATVRRCCSRHSNYHIHSWESLYPFRNSRVHEIRKLDSEEEANQAYEEALNYIMVEAVRIWWDEWYKIVKLS